MKPLCVVSCPIDTFSGYGARSRDFVKALIKVKGEEWDIKILPQRWGETPWNFLSEDDPLKQRFIPRLDNKPDIWMQLTIPSEFQPIGKHNIGITAGIESTLFPGEWIEGLNRMDLNLVSSNHSKDIATSTVYDKVDKNTNQKIGETRSEKPIEVLFEGLDLNSYNKKPKTCMDIKMSEILKDIPEEFCFLFTGHWLPGNFGEDRKNVGLLIKTFLETFNTPSKKKPALILKTNKINYSLGDKEQIITNINTIIDGIGDKKSLPNIYLLHGEMTDKEMNLLNNDPKVKIFLSFTKGEGFGRPLLEAAITGKPIIATNWSGHLDFLKPDYNILLGGELKPVHESAANPWLLKESQWFNVNTEVAQRAMKEVYKHYKNYAVKSRKQTQYIKSNWSFNKMAEKLNDILPSNVEASPKPPQNVGFTLPKLKKVKSQPKVELPKLQKIKA